VAAIQSKRGARAVLARALSMNTSIRWLDWRFVRSLGELQILTRASYAMLGVVPILAGLWNALPLGEPRSHYLTHTWVFAFFAALGVTFEAHPVVPGSPICGTRIRCGGRLRRAREGIEWLAVIGVSTVPHELVRGCRTATGMRTTAQGTRKTGKPSPFQNSPASARC